MHIIWILSRISIWFDWMQKGIGILLRYASHSVDFAIGRQKEADPKPSYSSHCTLLRSESFVETLDFLDFLVTAHVDTRSIVDVFRHNLQHPSHIAVEGLTAGYRIVS